MKKLLASAIFFLLALQPAFGQPFSGFAGGSGGGGGGGGSGTVQSISPGCGASTSPNPITTTGTASVLLTPVTISGASPAVSVTGSPFGTNCGAAVYLTNAGSDTPTIPEAGSSGYATGFFMTICVPVAFTKTITPAAGTIGGAASYALTGGTNAAPACIRIQSDGVSNYSISQAPSSPPLAGLGVSVSGSTVSAGIPTTAVTGGTQWYMPITYAAVATGSAVQSSTIVCSFGGVPTTVTVKSLGTRSTTTSSGNHESLAVYSYSAGTLTHIDDTGSITLGATNAADVTAALGATHVLTPGVLYAWCSNADNTTAVFNSWAGGANGTGQAALVGSATIADATGAGSNINGYQIAQTFGTWPGTITFSSMSESTNGSSKVPAIAMLLN